MISKGNIWVEFVVEVAWGLWGGLVASMRILLQTSFIYTHVRIWTYMKTLTDAPFDGVVQSMSNMPHQCQGQVGPPTPRRFAPAARMSQALALELSRWFAHTFLAIRLTAVTGATPSS